MLLTCKELAKELKVHPGTVRRWAKRGVLPEEFTVKLGNGWRFNADAIQKWLLERRRL